MQDAHRAGTPAGGSDGSWIQAQNADVTGNYFKWHHAFRHAVRQRSGACPCTTTASTRRATCVICYHTVWYSTECWEH
eukprot:206460-Pyramimonas_sp.AAC.1